MPNRVELWTGAGVPLVIGRCEGYRFWDVDGHDLQDLHLNGGTYNLGHRHPAMVAALVEARLAELAPGDLPHCVFTPSGSEANDVAIKSACWATGRRRILSCEAGYRERRPLPDEHLARLPTFPLARALSYLGWSAMRARLDKAARIAPSLIAALEAFAPTHLAYPFGG